MILSEWFWSVSSEDLKKGYTFRDEGWVCLICGSVFERERVYPMMDGWYTAEKAIDLHVQQAHGGTWDWLINMEPRYTGLTEVQKELLNLIHQGKRNREIAQIQGSTESTLRNHRFRLREKAKQARVFLAIWEHAEAQQEGDDRLVEYHKTATMVDDRYAVTQEEETQMIARYFLEDGRLSSFPKKQKSKWIVLRHITKTAFQKGKEYSEKDINLILMRYDEDYVALRRYLIEYGFLQRTPDGKAYWVPF